MSKELLKERTVPYKDYDAGKLFDKVLVLHNDEVNTFDHVISTLIKVCKHEQTQAEQCAYITHYKGKCEVKNGSYEDLKPMREALIQYKLQATID